MKRCLITYKDSKSDYSPSGLNKLSPRLNNLNLFPYTVEQQIREATLRMNKMSVQGVQPKLSATLRTSAENFELVDSGGVFIIKPQNPSFPELPENEDLTMRLAKLSGIEVPLHGLIRCTDQSLSYFIKRFDRVGKKKIAVEDFAQLSGNSRDTKYSFSVEKLIPILDFCTYPKVERSKFLKRALFSWLIGNEDMHLKNYSLITRNGKTELAPAYDFLNSAATYHYMGRPWNEIEESALPLAGKKRKLTVELWLDYLGKERLELPNKQIYKIAKELSTVATKWFPLVEQSFLSEKMKLIYTELIQTRIEMLNSYLSNQ